MKLTADERRDWRRAKQDGWLVWHIYAGRWDVEDGTRHLRSMATRYAAIRAAIILWRAYQEIRRLEDD